MTESKILMDICPDCNGLGGTCRRCLGTGFINRAGSNSVIHEILSEPCPVCRGGGWILVAEPGHVSDYDGTCRNCPVPIPTQAPCDFCSGLGKVTIQKRTS
jgi:DnaJ-class molecular chaperone